MEPSQRCPTIEIRAIDLPCFQTSLALPEGSVYPWQTKEPLDKDKESPGSSTVAEGSHLQVTVPDCWASRFRVRLGDH